MDLGAYAQIEDLGSIMAANGISVPRLRGLRLMKDEEPISEEAMESQVMDLWLTDCERACESNFVYDPFCFELSSRTRKLERRYLVYDGHVPVSVRWDVLHGKKRKLFKYNLKRARRNVYKSLTTFNKYCGRNDILYIHARIGGGNWPYYRKEVENQPWFIEKIDDPFDSTYCDIYARIKPAEE